MNTPTPSAFPSTLLLICFVLGVVVVALVLAFLRKRRAIQRSEPTPLEIYVAMQVRKHNTMRRMRAIAREHRRSTQAHHDNWR